MRAEDVGRMPSEQIFGGAVRAPDTRVAVDRPDRVGRGLQNGLRRFLARLELRSHPAEGANGLLQRMPDRHLGRLRQDGVRQIAGTDRRRLRFDQRHFIDEIPERVACRSNLGRPM